MLDFVFISISQYIHSVNTTLTEKLSRRGHSISTTPMRVMVNVPTHQFRILIEDFKYGFRKLKAGEMDGDVPASHGVAEIELPQLHSAAMHRRRSRATEPERDEVSEEDYEPK